ncbi:hypothetical protein HZA42_01050 [Candidatus Peregrinibacteria bacterium]|nr:hypothetical protein [Candidatus Peregrinibacteria bacterium]
MKNKNHLRTICAFIILLIMVGATIAAADFTESETPSKQAIENCAAKIFEYDREQIFSDVPIQQWYTHSIHFLSLLDENIKAVEDENTVETMVRFFPSKAITRAEFFRMLKSYGKLFRSEKEFTLTTKTPNKKVTQKEFSLTLNRVMGIPVELVTKEFKKNKIRGLSRRDAAYVLLKAAEASMISSAEETICQVAALEDPDNFEEIFGTASAAESPTQDNQDDSELPSPPQETPQMDDRKIPSIISAKINFAPVNPRAGESVKVKVQTFDSEGKTIGGASLKLGLSAGLDSWKYLPLKETSSGNYEGEISSQWAGKYLVAITDGNKTFSGSRELVFQPHYPAELKLSLETSQAKSSSKHEAVVAATLRDKFGNVIETSARDYRVTTSLGTVKKTEQVGQETFITIESDQWGPAEISISHLTRSVQDASAKISVPFSPYVVDVPKGMDAGNQVKIPVYLFLPQSKGKIAQYRFSLDYEARDLTFQNITDLDPNDAFDAAKITVSADGTLLLEQTTHGLPVEGAVPVGMLNFISSGVATSGTIMAHDGTVLTDHEKIIAIDPSSEWGEDFFRWWYGIKPYKTVCLDIWMAEGSGVNRTEALKDAQKASDMYLAAALKSFCPFYINFDIHFHTISAADWTAKVDAIPGTANVLDSGEEANLRNNFPGTGANCVQIWYVPDIAPRPDGLDPAGLSYPNDGGIAVDNHGDGIDHVLGHELNHQLSGNDVLDSPNDQGNLQGARDPKNPMNYNDPGFKLNKAQCDLIKRQTYIQ